MVQGVQDEKGAQEPPGRSALSPVSKAVHCVTKEQRQREESGKGANELMKEKLGRGVNRNIRASQQQPGGLCPRAGKRSTADLRSSSQVPKCVGWPQGQGRRTASVLVELKAKLN